MGLEFRDPDGLSLETQRSEREEVVLDSDGYRWARTAIELLPIFTRNVTCRSVPARVSSHQTSFRDDMASHRFFDRCLFRRARQRKGGIERESFEIISVRT
jgi:hypothetical protein